MSCFRSCIITPLIQDSLPTDNSNAGADSPPMLTEPGGNTTEAAVVAAPIQESSSVATSYGGVVKEQLRYENSLDAVKVCKS